MWNLPILFLIYLNGTKGVSVISGILKKQEQIKIAFWKLCFASDLNFNDEVLEAVCFSF